MNSWNGDMPGCLGKNCPTPCCGPKKTMVFDPTQQSGYFFQNQHHEVKYHGPEVSYFTTLLENEHALLKNSGLDTNTYPKLEKFSYNEKDATVDYVTRTIYTLSNCLSDSGCGLGDKRPSMCKIFPFAPYADHPLTVELCPQAAEIANHKENVTNALRVIKSIPSDEFDAEKYLDALIKVLHKNDIIVSWTKQEILEAIL